MLTLCDGEDNVDGVFLDLQVDLGDAWVILNRRVGVHVSVHVANSVIWGNYTSQFTVTGVMESSVS